MASPTSSDSSYTYVIRIARGTTKFPERPIRTDRFLIGAGSNCQLQLGGDTPMLHSIIVTNNDELWIDAVVPTPTLLVNGKQVRESKLAEGDIINIGHFSFEIGLRAVANQKQLRRPNTPSEIAAASASQLVDLLEVELSDQARMLAQREIGAAALLKAIQAAENVNEEESIQQMSPPEQLKDRAA